MYFLIGAIVSTIVLVIYSQSFPLLHYFAISGACSPHPFHPAQENQLGDPSVPRGRPRGARHAPPRPRAPPHLPRPRHHHRHLDVRQPLDIHCRRSDRGQGDQVHQVYARLLLMVDEMVRATVVVVLSLMSRLFCPGTMSLGSFGSLSFASPVSTSSLRAVLLDGISQSKSIKREPLLITSQLAHTGTRAAWD